jgi:hypothetical protein
MDLGDIYKVVELLDLSPCAAKAVRQMSSGYVASVAQTPALAPETNATVVGEIVVEDDKKCAV